MSQPPPSNAPKPAKPRLRHRTYPRRFTGGAASDLQDQVQIGLHEEAALLRQAMRRTLALAADVDDLDEMIKVLRAISGAAGRLAVLLRAQSALPTGESDAWRDLLGGLADETLEELRQKAIRSEQDA